MTDEQAESSRSTLLAALSNAKALLARYSVKHWPDVLEKARNQIEDRNLSGVDMLFSIFGGMGSFNDIVIHPINGNPVDPADVNSVNEAFQSLKGEIYDLTVALRHYGHAR